MPQDSLAYGLLTHTHNKLLGFCMPTLAGNLFCPRKKLQATHPEGVPLEQHCRHGMKLGGSAESESTSVVSSYLAAEGQSNAVSGKPSKHKWQRPGIQETHLLEFAKSTVFLFLLLDRGHARGVNTLP